MRKMITLIAAAALVASPFAFAEETTGNPNDVLQTVPGQETAGPTIADNTAPAAPDAATAGDATPSGNDAAAEGKKPTTTHKKHHVKKHHKHHHHKTSSAPSSDTHTSKEEPTSGSGTDMSAPAAAPTGQ
jgi:hypothetical protein